jgi:hypothetical protein
MKKPKTQHTANRSLTANKRFMAEPFCLINCGMLGCIVRLGHASATSVLQQAPWGTIVAQINGTNRSQVYGQDGKLYYASQTRGPQAASTTKYLNIGGIC